MKTRRGDVILVLFPNSDLRTAKRRPALVLQRDNLASGIEQTIVMTDNLATVLDAEVDSVLGRIADMSGPETALKHTLALP